MSIFLPWVPVSKTIFSLLLSRGFQQFLIQNMASVSSPFYLQIMLTYPFNYCSIILQISFKPLLEELSNRELKLKQHLIKQTGTGIRNQSAEGALWVTEATIKGSAVRLGKFDRDLFVGQTKRRKGKRRPSRAALLQIWLECSVNQ